MREGYSVTVRRWGEEILTIEPNMLSGDQNLSDDDLRGIRGAGEHLLGFVGDHLLGFAGDPDAPQRCFVCCGEAKCAADCPLNEFDK